MISPLEVDIGQGRITKCRTGEAERSEFIQREDESECGMSQLKGQVGYRLRTGGVQQHC